MDKAATPGPRSADVVVSAARSVPVIAGIDRIALSREKVARQDWRNRSFKDVNALGAEFENCDFRYSNFERGYFRDAKFTNCNFVGARFMDCNFKSANFYKCDLKFVQFQRCLIDVKEIVACLPSEPNIRREALQNLRANATEVGDYASQSLLVLQEVEAMKRHYSYAISGFDSYYRNKYSSFGSKIKAFTKLASLEIGGRVWGHGEKPWRLFFSCLVGLCILSFINFWNVMPRVGWEGTRAGLDVFEYIIHLFLDMSPKETFKGYAAVDYAVVVMRYIYIGLFISILYKAISHR